MDPRVVPQVSILLPTFDRLEFLPATIASVMAQTLTDWELLIADDGSAAPTQGYLGSLTDRRIKVLWLAHSGRPTVTLNAALRAARGEYIAFLDSDDIWLPRKLEAQVHSLHAHPARLWSCTAFTLIDAKGRSLTDARRMHWAAPSGWVRERLLTDAVIAMASVIVVRKLLEEVGPLDEELVMCYDDELWLRLGARSELDGIDEPLTLIRRHGMHGGSDVIAWRDRRRVVEKALRSDTDSRFRAVLRAQRAAMSAGLARSQAVGGQRLTALRTLAASAPYSWRYAPWWRGALAASARVCTPQVLRKMVRGLRT
jgi:glycosyltransferase involved in cell wall biosynthesis